MDWGMEQEFAKVCETRVAARDGVSGISVVELFNYLLLSPSPNFFELHRLLHINLQPVEFFGILDSLGRQPANC